MIDQSPCRVVAVDSMILAYAVRKTPAPADKVRRAKYLFDEFQREDAVIIVSAVVVAEYLGAVAEDQRKQTAEEIGARFQVEPFDQDDTVLAAKLCDDAQLYRQRNEEGQRHKIKADSMIIATAANRGAGEFFTEDGDSLKMAERFGMIAKKLPDFQVPDIEGHHLFEGK